MYSEINQTFFSKSTKINSTAIKIQCDSNRFFPMYICQSTILSLVSVLQVTTIHLPQHEHSTY